MTPTDVARAVALIENGRSYTDVADMLGKSKSTIYRNVRRWRQTGEYVRRRGQGRKWSTTARDRHRTVPQIKNQLEEVRGRRTSHRTISRRLKEIGLKAYRTKKTPKLQQRRFC